MHIATSILCSGVIQFFSLLPVYKDYIFRGGVKLYVRFKIVDIGIHGDHVTSRVCFVVTKEEGVSKKSTLCTLT